MQCQYTLCESLQKILFRNIYKLFPYMLYNIKYLLVISHSGGYPLSLIVTCQLCILCTTPWLFTLKKLCLQNLKLIFLNFFQFLTLNVTIKPMLTLFRMGWGEGGGKKALPTIFTPVTSTNVVLIFKNFLSFSFNPFGTRSYLVPVPNY